MQIAISEIVIPRKRMRDLGDVSPLAESMSEIGLLNPIILTKENRLIAGLHRIGAAKKLGWEKIECRRIEVSELEAEMAEIDENLIRNELTVLERAEHLKRRKEIYLGLHPETRAGVSQAGGMNRSIKRNVSEIVSPTFSEDTAKKAKVSRRTVEQEVSIASAIPEEVKEKLRGTAVEDCKTDLLKISRMEPEEQEAIADKIAGGAKSVKDARKEIHREAKTPTREDVRESVQTWRLIHSGCGTAEIADESVDCIVTDPPYPQEFLPCYSELGSLAARVLKPGGSCVVMVGQSYLPDILRRLGEHMEYHWMAAYLTPGGQAVQLWDRHVNTFWKPLLWFVKPPFTAAEWQGDVLGSKTNDNDKRFHDWGQSESGMAMIVDRFTFPGQTVLDPFCGGGTTGVVCLKLGRQFVGVDCDEAQIAISNSRLKEISNA